jgi:hypothetical protein
MQLTRYAMCNSAMAAMAYDSSIVDFNYTTPDTDTDLSTRLTFGLANKLNPTGSETVNFYLQDDYALGQWSVNNEFFKPQSFVNFNYYYHPYESPGRKLTYEGYVSVRPVTSVPEAMGYVTQSRSKAAGVEESIGGSVGPSVNMGSNGFNFGTEHSAEWAYSIQRTRPFWKEVLSRFDNDVTGR